MSLLAPRELMTTVKTDKQFKLIHTTSVPYCPIPRLLRGTTWLLVVVLLSTCRITDE